MPMRRPRSAWTNTAGPGGPRNVALFQLEWEKSAFTELSELLSRNPGGAQAVIDLALRAAEDPRNVASELAGADGYFSVQGEGWFIVYALDRRMDRLIVVGLGPTA